MANYIFFSFSFTCARIPVETFPRFAIASFHLMAAGWSAAAGSDGAIIRKILGLSATRRDCDRSSGIKAALVLHFITRRGMRLRTGFFCRRLNAFLNLYGCFFCRYQRKHPQSDCWNQKNHNSNSGRYPYSHRVVF